MALNSVNIMGNLTRDPEMRYTPAGKGVCSLSIANNRLYTKNGERVSEVSYFDVEVWGVQAENCSKYLSKGSGVVIEGRLKQDRWQDAEGKTRSKVHVVAEHVEFKPKFKNDSAEEKDGQEETGDSDLPDEAVDFPEESMEEAS